MEKPKRTKPGVELDKFKRRLIRAVARLLLQEKKPEAEIWKELKKETGCCQLLWTRMRALTLKKLDRLLAANDCMDALPNAARMSLTDWLLFDLVLVHQKIDLIGQGDNKEWEDRKVLVELFRLVKKFNIECQSGDKLTEAWSLATLYYNKKGHHCSPMLLQRRWYQLKEVTRHKFYNFWFACRGNLTRIEFAERYRPSPLQTEIAKTFKHLVTEPFLEWDELIKRGLVSLPQEFEKKMKERAALRKPVPKTTEDVPDLVMIEPRIETIDLRLEPDENTDEDNKQEEEEEGEVIPPPLIRIKEEPQDDIEVDETQLQPPKKSLYEVVLERTALENEELDSLGAADLNPENNDVDMEIQDTVREELALPQIASVFGNVSDTSVLAKIDENRVYSSAENTVSSNIKDTCDDNVIASDSENKGSNSNNIDPNSSRNNDAVIEVSSDNKEDDICDNSGRITLDGGVSDKVNEISDDDNSGNLDTNNDTSNVEETSVTANAPETNITANVEETNVSDNAISNVNNTSVTGPAEISSDVVKTNVTFEAEVADAAVEASTTEVSGNVNETNTTAYITHTTKLAVKQNASTFNVETAYPSIVAALKAPSVTNTTEVIKDIEIIETTSEPVVIMDSDDDDHHVDDLVIYKPLPISSEGENKDQPMEVDSTVEDLDIPSTETLKVENVTEHAVNAKDIAEEKVEMDIKPDVKSFNFGELSNDISFVDEGIEFVDDGIVYVDEDSHTETKIKCEKEDEGEDTPKIDVKLLMCPVVYTTRLDDMGVLNAQINNMYINDKHLIDSIIKKSKPIKQEPKNESKDTVENITINYCGENIDSITVNDMTKTIEYVQKNVDEHVLVKDSNIIKKENDVPIEDIGNQNIVNVKSENDNKEICDDDEENFIDESLKVKPTSYLLQKPRSRTYHPYQLCKNPDFNTRLRRLSVGFFGSSRNRVLIKSCKPLTIDLSKAFESKLLSGTLYLKPADHNTVTETINDSQSHVSVVPSAMPAQSLIDNSKVADILPMLHQSLQASKQPENIVPTSERNKVINLPDITEIRRINQRLLTAEVTPIQVQNNQPQVPVTIVTTSSNTSTNPAENRTIAETNTDLRSIVSEATDARGPPKLLEITDDPPSKKNQIGGKYDFRQFTRPTTAIWKPRYFRPEIPWLSRKNQVANTNSNKTDETLLTLDALNKMLFILTDKLEPEVLAARKPKPKPKRKTNDLPPKQRGRPKITQTDTEYLVLIRKAIEEDREQSSTTDALSKWQNPRFNIKAATNYPPDRAEYTTGTGTDNSKKKIKYCCWARQRMLQLLFCRETIPPHGCPRKCKCCCKNLLRDYTLHEQKIKQNELVEAAASLETVSKRTLTPIQSSVKVPDVEIVNDSNGESVQCLSVGMEPVPEETPTIDVDVIHTEPTANTTTPIEPIDVEAIDTEGDVPAPSVQVSVTTTGEMKKLAGRGLEVPVNVVAKPRLAAVPNVNGDKAEIRYHNFISCAAPQVGESGNRLISHISSDYHSGGVVLNAMKNSTAVTPISNSPPTLEKLSAIKKSKMPNRYKTTTPRPPNANKPFEPPKIFKEKMIFLNSKQISEKPSKSPVFLGKNKILLTTVKFPPNLNLFEEAKKALRSSLKLPDGVHLVLLPDGTIVYKIDQNMAVNATDVMKMPAIIATVQAYMNTKAAKEATLKNQKGVKESEVVDLIDDEDESEPNASNIENNEIPLGIENQIIEETVSNNNNLEMNMSNETEENQIDSNINSDVTETKSHEKDSADQDTLTEIQKDVRVASQNETLSVSKEQVYNQSDTNQTVSAEIDDQPKSSSQDELTDAHLVSSDQTQNQCDPTRQTVIAEKDEQPQSSNQTGSTDVHEGSLEQAQNQLDPATLAVNTEKNDESKLSSQADLLSEGREVSSEQTQNQSDPTRQTVIAEKDEQPQSSNQTGSTDVHEGSSEQALNQLDPTTLAVNAENNDESKLSSQADLLTDGCEVSSEQKQNQSEQSSQNVSIEVKDHIETVAPEESTSEPSRPKTKNILSDLMEMSGIFDEDVKSEIEETQLVGTQAVLGQVSLVAALPEPHLGQPPAPVSAETSLIRPILIPPNFSSDNHLAPKLRTPLSDLTPITSLYELKYACANNGLFFKLDFETGYLVPINVCMKPTVMKPTLLKPMQPPVTLRTIAPKSVIDLTEDDDNPEQKDTEPDTSPSKESLLIVNSAPTNFSGPVKPVKMFKALKPSILRRLNQGKLNLDGQDPQIRISLDHKLKRKQFLKKINLNAASSDKDAIQLNVPVRRYVKTKKVRRSSINTNKVTEGDEPTPTTSRAGPYKEFATTISSNDDSSDDEPLAKIAKRIHGNGPVEDKNESGSGTKHIDLGLPAADVQPEAILGEQTDSELPAAVAQPEAVFEEQTELELPAADAQKEADFEEQTESELPAADPETMDMSDDSNDEIDLQMAFGFESNDGEEDCILGV